LTFKENVPDFRNSRVPDIVAELREFGIEAWVTDPLADQELVYQKYGIKLLPLDALSGLDGVVFAVPHRGFTDAGWDRLFDMILPGGIFIDVKSAVPREAVPVGLRYWSL